MVMISHTQDSLTGFNYHSLWICYFHGQGHKEAEKYFLKGDLKAQGIGQGDRTFSF